ncbi:hypothetical protein PSECIP111854_01867 [Pseudoalteromonas sp. CIP111854]|uniref:Type II secretion system protein K n=2 Tax=Pseudoalteromonas holothuriae TaxID=2963714 RepID=A0A9W4QX38_9GAMM|nr:hypothetical protein PSECIP111854_01867 [Pseudoalteromonas sp. CIP111854]
MYQKGIALIQILLFSAILTIVALYFSGVAKNQVGISQLTSDRAEALVLLHGARQKLFFDLLTNQKSLVPQDNDPYQWNFFGDSFELAPGVTVQMYDLASRINIRYPERARLIAFLKHSGMDEQAASNWVSDLLDYQDTDIIDDFGRPERLLFGKTNRNGPLSDKSEIQKLGLEQQIAKKLLPNITLFRRSSFNPMNASPELLAALYGQRVSSKIIELRRLSTTTKDSFKRQTGIEESDGVFIFPSHNLQIIISSRVGEVRLKHNWTVKFDPYASVPSSPYTPIYIKE